MTSLLIDGNNLFLRTLFSKVILEEPDAEPKYALWRYLTFDQIMRLVWRLKANEVIIAVDGKDCWRKRIYKSYKANRKKPREESPIDWDGFFVQYNEWLEEIKNNLPFKVLKVKYCEADDIIGVLARRPGEQIVVSTDVDFTQLVAENVKIYNPLKQEKDKDPIYTIKDPNFVDFYALDGLKKDNIQNILTPLDWDGETKTPQFGKKKAQKILESGVDSWLEQNSTPEIDLVKRYKILKMLINLDQIPEYLVERVNEAYQEYKMPDPQRVAKFLAEKDWKPYREKISETEIRLMELFR